MLLPLLLKLNLRFKKFFSGKLRLGRFLLRLFRLVEIIIIRFPHLPLMILLETSVRQLPDDIIDHSKSGTAITIPTIPHNPPNRRMENNTQKLETPVVFPRIFGPMIFPSTC